MTVLRKLHLYGEMADIYGPEHDVCAATIGEAIRIVDCNHPGFNIYLRRRQFHLARGTGRITYSEDEITLGDSTVVEVLPHQYTVPQSNGDWHLIPAMQGSKSRSLKTVFSVVVGGALLATGVGGAAFGAFGAAPSATFATSTGFLGLSYGSVALLGASLFLGGINQLLAPSPTTSTEERTPTSFGFDGPSEIEDEGGAIPIIIGEVITGPVRVAASITTAAIGSGNYRNVGGKLGPVPKEGFGPGSFDFFIEQRLTEADQ
jgi:predicted phage tail protein